MRVELTEGCRRHGSALAIAAASPVALGLSAEQLTQRPSAIMASAVVGPMAANWKGEQKIKIKTCFWDRGVERIRLLCFLCLSS